MTHAFTKVVWQVTAYASLFSSILRGDLQLRLPEIVRVVLPGGVRTKKLTDCIQL